MTITINVPDQLSSEAQRAGLRVEEYAEQVIAERLDRAQTRETAQEFFDRISHPGPVIDTSRENIYADV
jgi:hypothetical protein